MFVPDPTFDKPEKPAKEKKEHLDEFGKNFYILHYLVIQKYNNNNPKVTAHEIASAGKFPTSQKPDHIKYYLIDLEKMGHVTRLKIKRISYWEVTEKGRTYYRLMKDVWLNVFNKPNLSI